MSQDVSPSARVVELDDPRLAQWLDSRRDVLAARGVQVPVVPGRPRVPEHRIFDVEVEGRRAGTAWLDQRERRAILRDLVIEDGPVDVVLGGAEAMARAHGVTGLEAVVPPGAVATMVEQGYRPALLRWVRTWSADDGPLEAVAEAPHVRLEPMTDDEFAHLETELTRTGLLSVAGEADLDVLKRQRRGEDVADHEFRSVVADGVSIGGLWWQRTDRGRHVNLLILDPTRRAQAYGRPVLVAISEDIVANHESETTIMTVPGNEAIAALLRWAGAEIREVVLEKSL